VLLENTAALAEFGQAGIPGAFLRDGSVSSAAANRLMPASDNTPSIITTKRRIFPSRS
jgi:hypothetical protein